MWLALQLACGPAEVSIEGKVYAGPGSTEPAGAGTRIQIRDAAAAPFSDDQVDGDGSFRVAAPEGADILAEITSPGVPATVFGGYAGLADFEAVPGSLYSAEELASWLLPFDGCAGLESGASVVGEVVFTELRDPETGARVPVSGALVLVAVDHNNNQLVPACFLDDEGLALAPDATVTGATGRFVVAGLPPGFHELRVGFQPVESGFDFTFWDVWLPEGGINPWFPAEVAYLE